MSVYLSHLIIKGKCCLLRKIRCFSDFTKQEIGGEGHENENKYMDSYSCNVFMSVAADGISAEVVNICTIKPIDRELVVATAKKTGKVVTVEEHSVIGGLGSAVCDVLSEECPTVVKKIGMQDKYGESGSAADLVKKYGLDGDGVYAQVKEFLG